MSCKDGECPVKTGTGFQTPLKDSAGDRPSITATSVPDAVCRVSCARSASASRDAHTHVPYCDTCLHLPRAQKSLHMDSGRHSCMPMHRLWPSAGCGPVRGLVCAVSARRCECQRQLQRACTERCLLFIHVILTIRILQVSMSWCATELVEMGVPSKWRVIMASSLYRPLGYRVPGRPTLFNSWQTCIGTT